jgi:hypothetical protein
MFKAPLPKSFELASHGMKEILPQQEMAQGQMHLAAHDPFLHLKKTAGEHIFAFVTHIRKTNASANDIQNRY